MQAKKTAPGFSDFSCSIARALDVVGEWWTLLIVRDLFAGMSRYDDIREDLGIASNMLAARLKRLLDAGIVERDVAPDDARSWEYRLTPKGRDLYPVILSLMAWGDKWATEPGQQPVMVVHKSCGEVTAAVPSCSVCREPLALADLTFLPGPGARSGPGTARVGRYLTSRP
ncbi:transcriptional regulator [Caenimonas koreensis DSM 17982]|uniref:Transcriptional regulator n=1 Tax=Caenimonas koreensis DSM 17982 TaxID=1121255 RepID=A0A844AV64_9BURK|nr:helix-turn-helix domain-containing protein [Caenimonas koreensis]MRD48285.1 transcriptional regulator [Caenimonas koreensis DSM 17982]